MCAFVSHPSVRVKGAENDFEPVLCMHPMCAKTQHWHCPFCVKSDIFADPLILKAHYRVKHVDKGIEFAGLKVLRCCLKCEMVGSIKGSKQFKSAHWHCYRCRNGFNRRDEAIKHYRTHFRNPQTTFQIQIAQEVNCTLQSREFEDAVQHLKAENHLLSIDPMNDANAIDGHTIMDHEEREDDMHSSVAAEETVGTTDGQQTMIIIEQPPMVASQVSEIIEKPQLDGEAIPSFESSPYSVSLLDTRECYKKQIEELQVQVQELKNENAQLEEKLAKSKEQLDKETTAWEKRERDLLHQLMLPLPQRTLSLFNQLKADHEALLHSHMQSVQQAAHSESPVQDVKLTEIKSNGVSMFIVEALPEDEEKSEHETGEMHEEKGASLESASETEIDIEDGEEDSACHEKTRKRKLSAESTDVAKRIITSD